MKRNIWHLPAIDGGKNNYSLMIRGIVQGNNSGEGAKKGNPKDAEYAKIYFQCVFTTFSNTV